MSEGPSLVGPHAATLLRVAAASIEHGLRHRERLPVDLSRYPETLRGVAASFVTLALGERLRGCIGSVEAWRPLVEDVAANAFASAFRDDRFPPLAESEVRSLVISISVLGTPDELRFLDETELLEALRPGTDGVIIRCDGRRAVFLPQVWRTLPEPREFLAYLKAKAGFERGYWSDDFRAWRFGVDSVSSETLPDGALWS